MLEANSPSQALLTGASHATLPEVSEVLETKQEEDRTCRGKLLAFWRQLTWERCQVGVVFMLFVVLRAMDRVFNKRVNDRMVNSTEVSGSAPSPAFGT